MNLFFHCGNAVHLLAFCILIFDLLKKRNCVGISGKTQILLATVFTCRYTDLITNYISIYNSSLKIVFIGSTFLILYLIYVKYGKTYDEENDKFCNILLIGPAAILGIGLNYYTLNTNNYNGWQHWQESLWTFSIYLEAVAILPQYYMIRKTGDGRRILPYALALSIYRALYILNWIYRYMEYNHIDLISSISGSLQTLILIIMIIDIQLHKEKRHKWKEITEVFTIEAAKVGQAKKDNLYADNEKNSNENQEKLMP